MHSHLITGWVRCARRFPLVVLAAAMLATGGALHYAGGHLGMNTDTAEMFSRDLPWRQDYIAYKAAFPQDVDNIVVVLDAATPELAASASRTLADALRREKALVESVRQPSNDGFFERHALLYLEPEELDAQVQRLVEFQPFLGALRQDPSLSGFATLLSQAANARANGLEGALAPIVEAIGAAAQASAAGRFYRVSWQELLDGEHRSSRGRRAFVVVRPQLDWGELFPAAAVIERIRTLARERGLVAEQGVRVRITGAIAMEHEELDAVMRGAGRAGAMALLMVAVVLVAGLRSLRLVAATLITLVLGLGWTAGFAALAVGHLNVISVAFAVLYIGLGVDYAIHFCLRYRELVGQGVATTDALDRSAGDVGSSLLICALTTGIGFYAFVPTDFLGVSELGLIAGTGMFFSLAATLSVLPALIVLMPLRPGEAGERRPRGGPRVLAELPYQRRRWVLGGALALALGACALVPFVRFDGNPVNLRDPTHEAVATFLELAEEADPSPWPLIVLSPDAEHAEALAARLAALAPVAEVRTLADFIPERQAEKLARVEELNLLLGFQPAGAPVQEDSAHERRRALTRIAGSLAALRGAGVDATALARARQAVETLAEVADAPGGSQALARFEQALLGGLAEQLRLLDLALQAEPVTAADLPAAITRNWVSRDGARKVEVYSNANLQQPRLLDRFLEAVRAVAPSGTGDAVVYVESGRAIVRAFQEAFALALVLITGLLWILLGRARHVVEVMGTLLFAALLTVGFMVLIDMPFNFANVIALPLLLGVGVDNGIHMVHRMRAAPPRDGNLLDTSTTRGVIVSGLTTVCGFGNLAFVAHPGTASMGLVLSVGLLISLITALVVLPALLSRARSELTSSG